MRADGFDLFDTAIGRCGIVWHGQGVVGVQLPEASERATRARISRRYPAAREIPAPAFVRSAITEIVSLVAGRPSDLSTIVLDMAGVPPLHREVYELAAGGKTGGFSADGGVATKLRLLSIERHSAPDPATLFDQHA